MLDGALMELLENNPTFPTVFQLRDVRCPCLLHIQGIDALGCDHWF